MLCASDDHRFRIRNEAAAAMKVIGVDVGGTFTDIVLADPQTKQLLVHKLPSTPEDPALAVMRGIREICERNGVVAAEVTHVFHGTTVATNAVIQHHGAKTGMITTRGYRDIIHIGRHQRPQHYSIMQEIPWQERPLVQRRFRKVATERLIPPAGEVLHPLNEADVREAARELHAAGVESIAVCFLFSYLNPTHEKRAKKIIEEECPGAFVTTSSEVAPMFREFERFTTAAMNAFIGPLMREYIARLEKALAAADMGAELHVMCSNGGVATPATISRLPVLTLMSGLSAGVMAGVWASDLASRHDVITLDIGGTSADIGVITGGSFSESSARDTFIGGYPLLVPMIDLHTIGAGGGTIAYMDEGGAFKVGPYSAGAVPGPAAYGQGGTQATVTDAHLVLGRLDKDNFLGGAMALDLDAATEAVGRVAGRLDMPLLETAEGIITVLNSNMANAIRARTVRKGIDPRRYVLLASGGAGPLHGADVARMLKIPEVIIPPYPGINSAMGLLTTDLKYDAVQTALMLSTNMDYARLNHAYNDMEARVRGQLEVDGVDPRHARYQRFADLRYAGQGYELRVEMPQGEITECSLEQALQNFHIAHRNEYGHSFPANTVEFVNVRITGIGPVPKLGKPSPQVDGTLARALLKHDKCLFRSEGRLKAFDTAFYRREHLPIEEEIPAPAIILQKDSTTVVPPDCKCVANSSGVLVITVPTTATQDQGKNN